MVSVSAVPSGGNKESTARVLGTAEAYCWLFISQNHYITQRGNAPGDSCSHATSTRGGGPIWWRQGLGRRGASAKATVSLLPHHAPTYTFPEALLRSGHISTPIVSMKPLWYETFIFFLHHEFVNANTWTSNSFFVQINESFLTSGLPTNDFWCRKNPRKTSLIIMRKKKTRFTNNSLICTMKRQGVQHRRQIHRISQLHQKVERG